MDNVNVMPKPMPLHLLKKITNNFSKDRIVGVGSYGKVYKGEHTNGEMIAVKVLNHIPALDDEHFEKEYQNIASLQHKNIVRLVSYCNETQREFQHYNGKLVLVESTQRALCFEYMQNGSLASFLTDESNGHDWCTRYAIIKGIFQGLKYLHEELDPPMYHLDLKPGNILLDEQMVPKIADFGLSRLFAGENSHITESDLGTLGFIPPEFIDAAIISIKFDIYSLGVVLIKILTGPNGYFRSVEMSPREFIELVHENWKNKLQKTLHMFDQHSIQVKRCIEIALNCMNDDRHRRPSIGVIINMLNEVETAFVDVQGMRPMPTRNEPVSEQLAIKINKRAALKECNIELMLELIGGDSYDDRPGLDLVAVLDVSSCMWGERMQAVKTAMRFVVRKLSAIDRLSVVTFSNAATTLCPLQRITEASQRKLQELIDGLSSGGSTNIGDGLQTGLKVLADDKIRVGRVAAIVLMSGGWESQYRHTDRISFCDVPVYTFGLGADSNPIVLNAIAAESMGGTFSHIQNIGGGGLTMAFSQCLAGLLNVAVQDLELTMTSVRNESKILKVAAGSYMKTLNSDTVTVRFGDIYSREVRKVIVELLLPATNSERSVEILEVAYSYSSSSGRQNGYPPPRIVPPPEKVTILRTGVENNLEEEKPVELQMEEARLQTALMINEARNMADGENMSSSQGKLAEAEDKLTLDKRYNPLLRAELQELIELFKTSDTYEKQGRPYALSLESSHDRQRYAARGLHIQTMRLYATPHMDMYLEQARKFLDDPAMPLPPVVVIERRQGGTSVTQIKSGSVQLVIRNNKNAPLLEYKQKVTLELTGGDCTSDRPGLDLVAILDGSPFMSDKDMFELKTAMRFVIGKLSPIDRLSVVILCDGATVLLFPLTQVTEASQRELHQLIDHLKFERFVLYNDGMTGLRAASRVLANQEVSSGRVAAIMFISNGCVPRRSPVPWERSNSPHYVRDSPVYSFYFGSNVNHYNPGEINKIAEVSLGGTFSNVRDIGDGCLTMALSHCLGGLLSVAVQDLKLTVAAARSKSRIVKVTAGSYPQEQDTNDPDGSVTVRFGILYSGEVRNVIVDLLLPAIQSERCDEILKVTYSYSSSSSSGREQFVALNPETLITVRRTSAVEVLEEEKPAELQMEEVRLQMANMIKDAVTKADVYTRLHMLKEALHMLDAVAGPLHPLLRTELQELYEVNRTYHFYTEKGYYYYALSSLSSHGRQRSTVRSGDTKTMRLFATPSMDMYLEQAKKFHQDQPSSSHNTPTQDDDESAKGRGFRFWPWSRRS